MSGTRERRKRRQTRQRLKHGPKAKPGHRLAAGRTGKVHHKRRASVADGASRGAPRAAAHAVVKYRLTFKAGQVIFEVLP